MKPWAFLNNPFLSRGGDNFKVAHELAKFTDAALFARIADPFFNGVYAMFHPLYMTLDTEYADWLSQGGIQKGSTLSLDQLLVQLGSGDPDLGITSRIYQWDLAVQNTFAKGTATYLSVFPAGRAPFQSGGKDSRIDAVTALSDTLTTLPALAPLKAMVDAFLLSLNDARLIQQGQLSSTDTDSDEVSAAVEAAMIGMFSVYGLLIDHYAATPTDAAALFDLELLRNLPQMSFTGPVSPLGDKFVAKRTYEPDRRVKVTNLGVEELKVAVASEKNDGPGDGGLLVPGNEDVTVQWHELKQSEDATYLKVYNSNPVIEGHFKIDILPEGND